MQLVYIGPREEIVIKEVGIVKKGAAFECTPELAAYLVKRFNLPGSVEVFTEKAVVDIPKEVDAVVVEKVAPKNVRKVIL